MGANNGDSCRVGLGWVSLTGGLLQAQNQLGAADKKDVVMGITYIEGTARGPGGREGGPLEPRILTTPPAPPTFENTIYLALGVIIFGHNDLVTHLKSFHKIIEFFICPCYRHAGHHTRF